MSELCERARRAALRGRAKAESLISGEYPLRVAGLGLEYIDLREYTLGDDFRRIDWRASARTGLEKLFVREYSAERRVQLAYIVDLTSSMSFKRKPEALAYTLALHARISEALRDEVMLVVLADKVQVLSSRRPMVAVEHVLRIICNCNMRGSLDLGDALWTIVSYARGLPLAVYTDYANNRESFKRIALTARASGKSVRFFIMVSPGEKAISKESWELPLFETESGSKALLSLAEFATYVRRHIASLRSALPQHAIVEVVAHGGTPALMSLVASYMDLRNNL